MGRVVLRLGRARGTDLGRGWYILVGLMTLLIVVLIGFAAYMTYEGSLAMCASGAASCDATPPSGR